MSRRICVVTGTRAEYGLLRMFMQGIRDDAQFELQTVVTGMHLSPEFGSTYLVIEADGFRIDRKVEMLLSSDSATAISKSVGLGVIGFADALAALQPDLLVVLGDRFEILAAVTAALFCPHSRVASAWWRSDRGIPRWNLCAMPSAKCRMCIVSLAKTIVAG